MSRVQMAKSYYITTPIYYVNDKPHIGHAYTTLACDVLARFKRLDGFDVMFLTGTDEHGQKVQKSAEAKGLDPKDFTDEVSQNFRDLSKTLGFTNDDFIRTTEARHHKAAQTLWQALIKNGDIYLGSYAGWYAVSDEAFYAENEVTDGKAPSGAAVEWMEEPSYFFRLSAYQDKLLQFYEKNPSFVAPKTRLNEVKSFVEGGLQDLSVSRTSFSWGVPVPEDKDHVMYVWLDALTNYMTAVGYGQKDGEAEYKKRWPADLHMVGKDILRFHTVYWPAFLMAAGLPVPKRVFAHGWWTNEGQKISKSLGNVIDPLELAEKYGLDQMRYFLLREVPFGNDGDYSHQAMVHRMNGDLANDLGNLCQRTLSMIVKNRNGVMPSPPSAPADADKKILTRLDGLLESQRKHYDLQQFDQALKEVWEVVGDANRYIDEMAPWALRKTDEVRMGEVLWVLAEILRQIAILIQPVMPAAAGNILDQLGIAEKTRGFDQLGEGGRLAGGKSLGKLNPVFPRFLEEEVAT
jgi:methionyl-tRNA synthetase